MNPLPHTEVVKKYTICEKQHGLTKVQGNNEGCLRCGIYYSGTSKARSVNTIKPSHRRLFNFPELPKFTDNEIRIFTQLTFEIFKMEKNQFLEGTMDDEELYDFLLKYNKKINLLNPNYAEFTQRSGAFKVTKK